MSSLSHYLLHPSRVSAFSYGDLRAVRERDEKSIFGTSDKLVLDDSRSQEHEIKIEKEAVEIKGSKAERPTSNRIDDEEELSSFEVSSNSKNNEKADERNKNSKEDDRNSETFVAVIAQSILSVPTKRMTLSSIYNYIARNYPHFDKEKGPGWRNSVRHNLSSNDCFVKASRAENGKGHYWMIHPKDLPEFSKGNFRRRRKPRRPKCSHSLLFRESPFLYHTFTSGLTPHPYQHLRTAQDLAEMSLPLPYGSTSERTSLTQADIRPRLSLVGSYDESRSHCFTFPSTAYRFGESNSARNYPNLANFPGTYQYPCACHR